MALRLPRIPLGMQIIDTQGRATQTFRQFWQTAMESIEAEFGAIEAAAAAQAAADAAAASASTAQTAADSATTAASTAQTAADDAAAVAALANSGVVGTNIVTATDAGASATVNIAAHTRVYGDGTSVSVNSGSVGSLAYSTGYYVYYDQASRLGGAVTYQVTTSQTTAAQTGDRHLVGFVTTPAAAAPDTGGEYVGPPGIGNLL